MNTKKIALLGLMLAVIVVLSALESLFLPLPFLPPHTRPGLSNVVIMYCVFNARRGQAVSLNAAKALFVFLTRGAMAGLLSLCGGMLSIAVIILLIKLFDKKISYAAVSVAGACAHNLGQYAVVMVLVAAPAMIYYLPSLIISGILTGLLTGTLLKILMPALRNISHS